MLETLRDQKFEAEEQQEIQQELDRVLGGAAFASSPRCREFLSYVVAEALAGRAAQLKERQIASALFGRGDRYDPSEDSIVRVKAVEVRKRLAQHYAAAGPLGSGLRIELHTGGYAPHFVRSPKPPLERPAPEPPRPPRWKRLALAGGLALAVALGIAGGLRQRGHDPLDALWRPFDHGGPVILSLPSPTVYTRPDAQARPLRNYYVGTGAAYGAAQFGAMLGRRGIPFQVKIGPEVSFTDLKQQPAIFLGAYTSLWTLEFNRRLRFRIAEGNEIYDSANPARRWKRMAAEPGEETEDYALAARIRDSEAGQALMFAAGLGVRGTHAAAEFLTSPRGFQKFVDRAPGWDGRNFEAVLRTEIHHGTPGIPEVVAWRVW